MLDERPEFERLASLRSGNRPAAGLMLLSALCYSFIPLMLVYFGGGDAPFLFNAIYRFGGVIGAVLFLGVRYRDLLFDCQVVAFVRGAVFHPRFLWVIIPYFSFTAFAWSIRYIDVALTTIMQEIWPVFFILLTDRLLRREGRFDPPTVGQLFLVLVGFGGFSFVVFSQAGFSGALGDNAWIGVLLALAAALMASATSYNYRWAYDSLYGLVAEGVRVVSGGDEDGRLLFFFLMVAFATGSLVSAVLNLIPGMFFEEVGVESGIGWSVFLVGVLAGGVFLDAGGTVFNRLANLKTTNLGINALGYATPVIALVWLFLFSDVVAERVDYLVIGATAIVTANLLINFEGEVRLGFRALLLSLVLCGTVVYLRDVWFDVWGIGTWVWSGGGYFESVALSATVFTLLLAFRVSRLVTRTSEEDDRTFVVLRNLDLLVRRQVVDEEALRYVLLVDQSRDPVLVRDYYVRAVEAISSKHPESLDEGDRKLLAQAQQNLDSLLRSKQVDIHLGEIFALVIFAAVTVVVALFSVPSGAEGWTRLLADIFAMVISSVVIFLLFHILDLQRERDEPKLELLKSDEDHPQDDRYVAMFSDTVQRSFNQYLSIFVGVVILVTYGVLLGQKWLD